MIQLLGNGIPCDYTACPDAGAGAGVPGIIRHHSRRPSMDRQHAPDGDRPLKIEQSRPMVAFIHPGGRTAPWTSNHRYKATHSCQHVTHLHARMHALYLNYTV